MFHPEIRKIIFHVFFSDSHIIKIMNDFSQHQQTTPEWVYYNHFKPLYTLSGMIIINQDSSSVSLFHQKWKDPAIHAGPHSVFDTVRLPRQNVHHCRLMLDRLYRCLNYMMCSFFTAFSFLVFVSKYLVSDLTILQFFVNYRLFYQIFN